MKLTNWKFKFWSWTVSKNYFWDQSRTIYFGKKGNWVKNVHSFFLETRERRNAFLDTGAVQLDSRDTSPDSRTLSNATDSGVSERGLSFSKEMIELEGGNGDGNSKKIERYYNISKKRKMPKQNFYENQQFFGVLKKANEKLQTKGGEFEGEVRNIGFADLDKAGTPTLETDETSRSSHYIERNAHIESLNELENLLADLPDDSSDLVLFE